MQQQSLQATNAWRILFLLFLANLFNFFDRTIPAIIIEPIRMEWNLSDLQLGLIGTAFTIVYAIAGIPLGRMADTGARRKIMGWGLAVWSGLTAVNGLAWNFFMLGLPIGLLLAFFTIGAMVKAFDSWRAPFFIAAVPGLILALFMFFIKEPKRGAAELVQSRTTPVEKPLRKVMAIRTFWWLVMAGLAFNFATYACNSFMVPMLQRYFLMPLEQAAMATGVIVGLTGLVGLTLGGWLADKIHQRWQTGRLLFAALSMFIASVATGYALLAGQIEIAVFVALFSIGWLFAYNFYTCVYTAIQDVIEPRLRATAMALFFAGLYLLGGGLGPLAVGMLSDHYSHAAMLAAGASEMNETFKAVGLHNAMYLIPVALMLTMVALLQASRCFVADAAKMQQGMTEAVPA